MNDESEKMPGLRHAATQPACGHWAPIELPMTGAPAVLPELPSGLAWPEAPVEPKPV